MSATRADVASGLVETARDFVRVAASGNEVAWSLYSDFRQGQHDVETYFPELRDVYDELLKEYQARIFGVGEVGVPEEEQQRRSERRRQAIVRIRELGPQLTQKLTEIARLQE